MAVTEIVVVVANYTSCPVNPNSLTLLAQEIQKRAPGIRVRVEENVIDRCYGWLPESAIAARWPNEWGVILLDPNWPCAGCQPYGGPTPDVYFRGRGSVTKAGMPLITVHTTGKTNWWVDAAVEIAKTLGAGRGSVYPRRFFGVRLALSIPLVPSVFVLFGDLLVGLGKISSGAGYAIRRKVVVLHSKDTPPPQGWGP